MHDRAIRPQAVPVRDWRPELPSGTLRSVVLHWTAGDYQTTFGAYHFCLTGAADVRIAATADLQLNMRDLRADTPACYAAHTLGRNSFAAGIAICAMADAQPHDFGRYPLTDAQVEALCVVTAAVVRFYGIPLDAVRTHAEAACDDGYFGAAGDDERWDIARLAAAPEPLRPADAGAVGDRLRARIGVLNAAAPRA